MNSHFYYSASEAATYLGLTPQSLAVYRATRTSPKFVKLGNTRRSAIVYKRLDLEEWDRQRKRRKRSKNLAGAV